jgi:cytochrome c oxidase cbb3-type subunit I/II
MMLVKSNVPTISAVKPYTPLELEGRDIYVREGCYLCHSQQIRPFRSEVERYGEYSKAGESVYDHPFQFGSKRTGPDLAREGVKTLPNYKPNSWHYNHMLDPQSLNPESIMPPYPWLIEDDLDVSTLSSKISTMQTLGVPYPEGYADGQALKDLENQAGEITQNLKEAGIDVSANKEIIALIAYLQRLGTDIYKDGSPEQYSSK